MADQKQSSLLPKRYRYLNDYTVRVQLDTRGREKQIPVYIGPYFRPLHSDEFYRTFRISVIVAAVLIIAAAFVILFFDTYAVYPNEGLYTLIPLTMALFPYAYLLLGFFRLPRANKRLQRDEYARSVRRIMRSSMAIAICAGLSLILWIIFLIAIHFQGLSWWDGLYTAAILIVAGAGLLIFFMSRKLRYEEEAAEAPHELQDAAQARSEE